MQMKPYQTVNPSAGANGDRIHVPMPAALGGPPPAPSWLTVFGREIRKRKKLVIVWSLVTVVVTAAVVFQFSRPLYRAEGKYAYQPNYNRGTKPIYTPPNIQSAVQILKAPEVFEPVRERHFPDMSKDEFGKNVRIEVARQSEFIDVTYDHPDAALATAVASDLMQEGIKHFAAVRVATTADAVIQVRKDRENATKRLEQAKDEFRKAHLAAGVNNPEVELITLQTGISDVNRQLRAAREQQHKLKKQIDTLIARRDAPTDPSDLAINDSVLSGIQALVNNLQTEALNQQSIDEARFKLEAAEKKELQLRPLKDRGILPQGEYDDLVAQIKIYKGTLAQAAKSQKLREELQQKYEDLKKQMAGGKPIRKAVIDRLEELRTEEIAIPATIAGLEEELRQKKEALSQMSDLQRQLGPLEEEIRLMRARMQDFDAQLNDTAAERGQDLNANDLRIHSPAATGGAPYSTNAPKLALAMIGASAFLLFGYMALFGLPRMEPAAPAAAPAPDSRLPRALVALVPFTQEAGPAAAIRGLLPREPVVPDASANGHADAPFAEPDMGAPRAANSVAEPGPVPPHTLAERLAEDGVDHGGIVLFTPTAEELQVAPAIGEMGEFFTRRGERVLVFDARADAETPSWAGPDAPAVANSVEGYLDGQGAVPKDCFVPTSLQGVEYSRADLSTRVGGVMAAHRFRQLVEEMRERYSLVFLVGPPVSMSGGDPLLATLAEGMVLVTESNATPTEVHAFVQSLGQQSPARLYGTLSVPRA